MAQLITQRPTGSGRTTASWLSAIWINTRSAALGPADRNVREFDCWHEEKLNGPFLCALHTDGVGRGLGGNPMALLDELEKLQTAGVENAARRFIEQAIEERPQDFDDNLTLAVIRGGIERGWPCLPVPVRTSWF